MNKKSSEAISIEIPVTRLKRLVKKAERSGAALFDIVFAVDCDAPVIISWRNPEEKTVTGGGPVFEADIIPTTMDIHQA